MVKKRRARARTSSRTRRPAAAWREANPAELCKILIGDVDAHARLLDVVDKAARPLRLLLPSGDVPVPVALIEPTRHGFIRLGPAAYDIRIAAAVKMGLPLAGPTGPPLATGWTFGKGPDGWELSDPTGTLVARCKLGPGEGVSEAAWIAQAARTGQVLVAYGMRVGVRVPDGIPARRYDDQARANELGRSLTAGQACTAMVAIADSRE
jgi:hypothetical protein